MSKIPLWIIVAGSIAFGFLVLPKIVEYTSGKA